jgi:hypothetical protein
MLLCNNTGIPLVFVINRKPIPATAGRGSRELPIIAAMTDADELARRYFALWADYLTALVSDPQAAALMQRWLELTGQFAQASGKPADERAGAAVPAWPPLPGAAAPGPTPAAAASAGASDERGDAVDELARRIGELERRLAAVERRPAARRSRRRDRASGE